MLVILKLSPYKVLICVGIIQMPIKKITVEDAGMCRGNIEKIFIDITPNEVNKDNMDSCTFSTNTWKRMLLEVNSQGKRNFKLK